MTGKHGVDLFKTCVDLRLLCCNLRKVRPLTKHLHSLDAWVTGLRRDQWASRTNIRKVEIDHDHGAIVKLNPLAEWTEEEVWDYVREREVPVPLALRPGLHVDRLRPVHARDRARRAEPRRPLVVGVERAEGVRHPLLDRERRARARAARAPRRTPRIERQIGLTPCPRQRRGRRGARAEAQAVLAMVQDEQRRGRLADVVAAVDDGEVEGADARCARGAARARALRPAAFERSTAPRASRPRSRCSAGCRSASELTAVGARPERGARRARGPHDRKDLGQRGGTWRIWSDDLDAGLRGRASARESRSPCSRR